jgi:hypothetical protein
MRNLSVIQEIESFMDHTVVMNTTFQGKKLAPSPQPISPLFDSLCKYFFALPTDSELYRWLARDYAAVLKALNEEREGRLNFVVYAKMLRLFAQTKNFKSVLVLVAAFCK